MTHTHTHTPEPWTCAEMNDWDGAHVIDKHGRIIADCQGCDIPGAHGEVGTDEAKANARLIAAAPELLAALQAVAIGLSPASLELQKDSLADLCRTCYEIIQEAIAKAEGNA